MHGRCKLQMNWRHRLTRLAALFFVMYALSDVSVLQVYCGNEAIGIPPAHHSSKQADDSIRDGHRTCSTSESFDCRQTPDDHEYDHQHECFCWQQVVVGYYMLSPGRLAELEETRPPIFYRDPHSDSAISHFFRPPRTAYLF